MRILLTTYLVSLFLVTLSSGDPSLDAEWSDYKQLYRKRYKGNEETKRRGNFENTVKKIKSYNKDYSNGKFTFTTGLNEFSDMTPEEITNTKLGLKPPPNLFTQASTYRSSQSLSNTPDQFDWRTKGAVTGVKDQGDCGSCWAFSTAGSIETQYALKTGKLVPLSEQHLVDCSRSYGNLGCGGGLMTDSFKFVMQNGGIATEASYPYTAQDGNCTFNSTIGANIKGYVELPQGNELTLKQVVAINGTVSVGIDANTDTFFSYSGGIYNDPSCSKTSLNHAVLVIGYGVEGKKTFWLLKNSWGTSWGLQGYMKLARNNKNQCGIASMASIPTV